MGVDAFIRGLELKVLGQILGEAKHLQHLIVLADHSPAFLREGHFKSDIELAVDERQSAVLEGRFGVIVADLLHENRDNIARETEVEVPQSLQVLQEPESSEDHVD